MNPSGIRLIDGACRKICGMLKKMGKRKGRSFLRNAGMTFW